MKEHVISIAKNLYKSLNEIKFIEPAQTIRDYVNGDKFKNYPIDKQCSGLLRLINKYRGDFQRIESEKLEDTLRIREAISLLNQFKDSLKSLIEIENKLFDDAYASFKTHYPANEAKNQNLAAPEYYTILETALNPKYTTEQKCLNFSILLNLDDDAATIITPTILGSYGILQFFIKSIAQQNISEKMALCGLLLLKQLRPDLLDDEALKDNIASIGLLDSQLDQALKSLRVANKISPDLIRSTCGLVTEKKANFRIPTKTDIFEFDQKKLPSRSLSGNYTQIRMQILTQSFMTLLENQNLPAALANMILQYFIPEDPRKIFNVYGDEIDLALYSSGRFNFTFFVPEDCRPKLVVQPLQEPEKEKCSLM